MIFVILGTQKFQFNRLLEYVDKLIEEGVIRDKVIAQTGYSTYTPQKYKYMNFIDRDEFISLIDECCLIITHGGTGAIINSIKRNKKVIAVPRLAKYNEHVDDHQIDIITEFENSNFIKVAMDYQSIKENVKNVNNYTLGKYKSNTQYIINLLDDFIK